MSHGPGPGVNQLPDLLNLLTRWRENAEFPGTLAGERLEDDRLIFQLPIPPYPEKIVLDEKNGEPKAISGPRRRAVPQPRSFRREAFCLHAY